jgi:hypothetical protein
LPAGLWLDKLILIMLLNALAWQVRFSFKKIQQGKVN